MPLPNALPTANWLALTSLLVLAAGWDLQQRRIPNRLLLGMAGAGLVLSALPQGPGLVRALAGGLCAGAAFLPLYLLRQMGAGDLKLMATVGLLVGMPRVAALCLSVAMAGGLLALFWLWRARHQQPVPSVVAARMPYAVAIALGSATHGLLVLPVPPVPSGLLF